ncbi:MAG TPA: hypothetical protein VGT40_20595 [Methylomirabilota bacterium]|nr:hypothetical protein [Methylomirabilota bacterium]
MRIRGLVVAWILVPAIFLVLLGLELSKWGALVSEGARAAVERQRLTNEIQLREQQLVAEMRRHGTLLQEMQWTASGGDPSAFLTRLAELAQEKRMKIMAIGPLERQATPQFSKSWHLIQIQAPYREIRELAARVEQEKGILDDVRVELAPAPPGPPAASPANGHEVQARFKMAALELSPQAKQIVERAVAATGAGAQASAGLPLALSVPRKVAPGTPLGRDPFVFLKAPAPPPRAAATAAPEKPAVPLDLKGIVGFPGGFLAIVNNQIVKVGDTVNGYRVERITENAVTLRERDGAPRTVELPELSPTAPAPRR